MKHSALLGALVWVCLPWLSLSSALKIQADRIRSVPDAQARAETIRDTFKRGWRTYRAHAWGHDESESQNTAVCVIWFFLPAF